MISARQIIKGAGVVSRDVLRIAQRELSYFQARPEVATLFLTYRCNSHCRTCTHWMRPQYEEMKKELDVREWKIIIDRLADAGVRIAEIFGGNVLLRKNLLISVLAHLKRKNFTIHLPTNQIGMDDETATAIVEHADFVYLSTDGVGDLQDTIRGQKGAGQRVEDAVAKLHRLRNGRKTPRLICNTTVSKFNVALLPSIAEYALARKFDEIHFEYAGEFTRDHVGQSCIEGIKPTPYFLRQEESILVTTREARELKESLIRIRGRFAGTGLVVTTVNIDSLSEQHLANGTVPYSKCYVERTEPVVNPSGKLIVCPFFNEYELGSLRDLPLDELWNNERHRKFRAYQNSGSLELCRHCILGVQRNPSVYGSLKRIYFSRIAPKLGRARADENASAAL